MPFSAGLKTPEDMTHSGPMIGGDKRRARSSGWKPGSQHAGEKRGVVGLLLGRTERAARAAELQLCAQARGVEGGSSGSPWLHAILSPLLGQDPPYKARRV